MPKVYLTSADREKAEEEKILQSFLTEVAVQGHKTGNQSNQKIAIKMNIPYSTFCYKMRTGTLDYKEIIKLFKVLNFSNEQILEVFGRKDKTK